MKHGYVDRVTDSGDVWVRHGDEKKGRNIEAKPRRPGSSARSPQVKAGGRSWREGLVHELVQHAMLSKCRPMNLTLNVLESACVSSRVAESMDRGKR